MHTQKDMPGTEASKDLGGKFDLSDAEETAVDIEIDPDSPFIEPAGADTPPRPVDMDKVARILKAVEEAQPPKEKN